MSVRDVGGGEGSAGRLHAVRVRLGSALAILLLPVLLAGLAIAAGGLGQLHQQARPAPTAAGVPGAPANPPLPESTPVPWPANPWFAPPLATNGDLPLLAPHARGVILVDLGTRRTLYQQNALEPLPTASLAKLMTLEVALRHASQATMLTVPDAATHFRPDDTTMGLTAGERLSVGELTDGVLLESANDAAQVLAQAIIPEPAFVADMNALAISWGLTDVSFTNPTGLDDPGEHASAYDLAVIASHLLGDHPELLRISDQKEVRLPQTPTHKAYDLWSLIGPVVRGFPGADGLKTGFTDAAGYCLALTDRRGGRTLLAIVLNSPTDVDDAQALVTYGFSVDPA